MSTQTVSKTVDISSRVDRATTLILECFDLNQISKSEAVSAMASLMCSVLAHYENRAHFDNVMTMMHSVFEESRKWMSEWISVKDHKPKYGSLVVGWLERRAEPCCLIYGDDDYWRELTHCDIDDHREDHVSHWMPLPEPPLPQWSTIAKNAPNSPYNRLFPQYRVIPVFVCTIISYGL